MNLPDSQYFLLVVPSCLILIGCVFIAGHFLFRAPRFLFWIGIGYILPSLALGMQSLMTNTQMTMTSPWVGILYLGGAWAIAHGMALKAKSKNYTLVCFALAAWGVFILSYFAYVNEQLWLRMLTINFVTVCLEAMVLPAVYAYFKRSKILNKILCISYFVMVVYTALRAAAILLYLRNVDSMMLSASKWWMMMLAASILLSIWFAIMIAATTVKELFVTLNDERYRDVLTGLYNRRGFFEKVKALRINRSSGSFYIVMCDIDHFKNINDTWGHVAGDKILRSVAKALKDGMREHDVIARFGGEEFILLLRCPDHLAAFKLADRVRSEIAQQAYTLHKVNVTVSFGMAAVEDNMHLMHALELADKRLYNAKRNGRNRVCYA